MSRRGRRNRGRGRTIAKAPGGSVSGVTFTPEQVAALTQLQQGNARVKRLPVPDTWSTDPFGPGRALPYAPINIPRPDSGHPDPRAWEYPVAENLQITTRQGHVPWATLQSAAEQPLFRKLIEIRKEICSLDFAVVVDPKAVARYAEEDGSAEKDVESTLRQKYRTEIARITDFFQTPDRKNGYDWGQWTSLLMENYLKYDATVVWPSYTYGGDLFAFKVIDGKTIKPLQDEYGERPLPDFPAYQQILYGFPRGEFTATVEEIDGKKKIPGYPSDQLLYERRIIRSESPYGLPPTEIALIEGLLWSRRFSWMLAEYTEGAHPDSFLLNKGETDWTPQQAADYERYLNQRFSGNIAERFRLPMLPPGIELVQSAQQSEKYRPEYDLFVLKLLAGCFKVPITEMGFTETGALGATFHEGNEDILQRQTRLPDAQWVGGIATKLAIKHLRMPPDLMIKILGLESEDEAAADAVAASQVSGARMTLNEDRARRGQPPYDFSEADMPMLITPRGIVFIEGASEVAPPGELVTPAQAPPTTPGQPGEDEQEDETQQGTPQQPPKSKPAGQQPQKTDTKTAPKPPPKAAKAELAALRKRLARHPAATRPFECQILTKAHLEQLAPELVDDPRLVLKDDTGFGFETGELVRWVADTGACPVCQANEDQGPIPFGTPFQGGEMMPPQHPHCECDIKRASESDG